MTTQIHLVTNAEADCHTEQWPQLFRGLGEGSTLTRNGVQQAEALGQFILEHDLPEATGIFVGPERRARDTAITAFDKVPNSKKIIEIAVDLRDRSYGELGKVPKKTTPLHVAQDAQINGVDIMTGTCIERDEKVAERMLGFLQKISMSNRGELGIYCFSDIEPVACLMRSFGASDHAVNDLGYAEVVSLEIADPTREKDFARSISA